MSKIVIFEVFGINCAPTPDDRSYDMHCPLMGSKRNNYYRDMCQERQGNKDLHRTCFPICVFDRV